LRQTKLLIAAWLAVSLCGISFTSIAAAPVVRIGVYHNPPKVQLQDQQISGIFGDLVTEIARREGWQIEAVSCEWNQCLQWLEQGRIDLMPDVALNHERDQRFFFHQTPILHSWSQLYGQRSLKISSLLDLDGVKIAVLENSVQQSYLQDIATNFGLTIEFVPVQSFDAGFAAVVSGAADVVAANHLYGDLKAHELHLEPTPVMFQPTRLYVVAAAPAMQSQLLVINDYIQTWRNDSDSPYYQILQRWRTPQQAGVFPYVLVWSLVTIVLLTLALALWMRQRVKQKTQQLRHSELKLSTILDSVEAYIYIKDKQLKYQYANKRVCDYLNTTAEAIIGRTDRDFFDQETYANLRSNDLKVIEQGQRVSSEEFNVTASGEIRQFLSVKIPLFDAQHKVYALCGISTDISEHFAFKETLNQLEFFDSVTGLANRKLLLQNLEHAVASASKTGYEGALVAIDLTHFTIINETLGHHAGDQVLQQMAARIRQCLGEADTAARLGSDDFVVILETLDKDPQQAVIAVRHWANRVLELLSQPYQLADHTHTTNACLGVTMFSDSVDDVGGLLRNADLAIAEAKAMGGGSISFFDPKMQAQISRRMTIEAALRQAINNQALEAYLQPQVNDQRQVVAAELLLRWTDPNLGVISPAEFIPIAESSGLIIELGHWVIEQACQTLQAWQCIDQLKHIPIAVNISPRQFKHGGFVEQIEQCIRSAEVPAGLLELEITEGMLIDDVEVTVKRMCKLGSLGVRFSLDDFGTGYASLAYLKRLPLYQLKIDQSFVRDMLIDNNDDVITATIIGLARNLNLSVIAEGVETETQLQHLRSLGCRKFQGYLFGYPESLASWQQKLQQSTTL